MNPSGTRDDAFSRALAAERLRSARQLFRFRAVWACSFLVVAFGLSRWSPGWVGPLPELEAYAILSLGLALVAGSDERLARMAGPSIALVDLPAALFLMNGIIRGLEVSGTPTEVAMWRVAATSFYIILVVSALLTLHVEQVWLTAVVALACQTWLLWPLAEDLTFVVVMPVTILLAVLLVTVASRRTVRLVEAVSQEQVRRSRMARYFSPQVAETIAIGEGGRPMEQRRVVSVLFCDLRGFTAMADRLSEGEIVALLNEFHTRMVGRVFEAGGTLDKLIGDGFMAYFGAPLEQPDHAARAVACALALHEELAAWNALRPVDPLTMGVGIHTGPVVLGDIGAPSRRDYTAVGRTVNVAARMEALTKEVGVGIVLSKATLDAVANGPAYGPAVSFRPLGLQRVRGVAEEVECFTPEAEVGAASASEISSVDDAAPVA